MKTFRCNYCGHRRQTTDDVQMVQCKYCVEGMIEEKRKEGGVNG